MMAFGNPVYQVSSIAEILSQTSSSVVKMFAAYLSDPRVTGLSPRPDMNHRRLCLVVKFQARAVRWSESSSQGKPCQQCQLKVTLDGLSVTYFSTYVAIGQWEHGSST